MCKHSTILPATPQRPANCAVRVGSSEFQSGQVCSTPKPGSVGVSTGPGAQTISCAPGDAEPDRLDIFIAACVFAVFATIAFIGSAWCALGEWWALKRVCSWCKCRMGGNPLARKVTHGICLHCLAEQKRQIAALNFTHSTGTTL